MMRIFLLKSLCLTGSLLFGQEVTLRLPRPTQQQIIYEQTGDKGFYYLEHNFKKVGAKIAVNTFKDCQENCICSWEQYFDKGIKYSYNDCHEAGFDVRIVFEGYNANDVIELVDTLFKTEENSWNEERTEYKPRVQEPGCYYKILKESGASVLEYYCGC